jgi:hypothetical protein
MGLTPDLFVYTKPGCGLCRQTLETLQLVLAARSEAGLPVPQVVERDITTNPAWERDFFDKIPVVDLADRRLELLIGGARLRRMLADVLDRPVSRTPGTLRSQGG